MPELIRLENLKKYFPVGGGQLHAVDQVNLSIQSGKTMGVVGESGCGKSTLGRLLVHLEESTGGRMLFDGQDVTRLGKRQLKKYREEVQFIFQDPYSSLNPRMTVEDTIIEPLLLSKRFSRREAVLEAERLMEMVGIDQRLKLSYPHELDGGRRQRVVIARSLSLKPRFVVCDEPVSALDVSIQAQVINLLKELQRKENLTYLFITHDLSVVRHISDEICVMYLGQIVELSPARELFVKNYHPYTKALLSAIPSIDIDRPKERILLKGELTSPVNPKPGCRFAARCNYVCEACHKEQQLEEISPGHYAACGRARELAEQEI